MTYQAIVPAELAFDGNGIPYAPAYGDCYHSASGALEQARHVFLAGNDLPDRWQGRDFVICETGFGLGLNFLATWQAWKSNPGHRLHYVAIEKHPFRLDDLKQLHARWPELTPFATRLQAQWPLPLPGLHRLDFGDVVLTLCFGDVQTLLPQLSLAADAFYLDGFAPAKNPEMWSDEVFDALAKRAAPDATLASWSVLDDMMFRLSRHGFRLEKRPGFGTKRYMLAGQLPGAVSPAPTFRRRRIAVIGAGIAGASVAHALAKRDHEVVVFEAGPAPAQGASGNHAGVFRPLPALDDSRLARLLRAGFLLGKRQFSELSDARLGWTGALHIARDAEHEATQRRIVAEHALPDDFCRFVERDEASALAGWPVELGGWWFPQAGWINPPSLCRALLADIEVRYGQRIDSIDNIDADEVVIANGIDAPALVPDLKLPIRVGRGMVSHVLEAATPPFDIVATRLGYVTPAVDGIRCAGATMASGDRNPAPRLADHVENLYRLEMLLPGFGKSLDPARLDGRVSFRPMSPDRLPIVGPLVANEGLWIIDGFGARGLVFASICAELLAGQIDNEPLPLETELVTALAPGRFTKSVKNCNARH
ncbi:MAG: FAD-dependent 5-carboxymethylaminomethyl-2-thiouridine(34) oxidoreductase MnmC [Pseudomonadota bacterium]